MTYSVIDTRDLIEERDEFMARLEVEYVGEYAETVREGLFQAFPWLKFEAVWPSVGPALDEEEQERLNMIHEVVSEIGDEAEYGVALIPVDDFTNYAEDLADDLGVATSDFVWPTCYIDWEAAADALAQDYSLVTFDGQDWYYRA